MTGSTLTGGGDAAARDRGGVRAPDGVLTGTKIRQSGPAQLTTTASCASVRHDSATVGQVREPQPRVDRGARAALGADRRAGEGGDRAVERGGVLERRRGGSEEQQRGSWAVLAARRRRRAVTDARRGGRGVRGGGDARCARRRGRGERGGDGARAVGGEDRGAAGRADRRRAALPSIDAGDGERHARIARRLARPGDAARSGRPGSVAEPGAKPASPRRRRASARARRSARRSRRACPCASALPRSMLRRLEQHEEADQQQREVGERHQPERARPGRRRDIVGDHATRVPARPRAGVSRSASATSGASSRARSTASMRAWRAQPAAIGMKTRLASERAVERREQRDRHRAADRGGIGHRREHRAPGRSACRPCPSRARPRRRRPTRRRRRRGARSRARRRCWTQRGDLVAARRRRRSRRPRRRRRGRR